MTLPTPTLTATIKPAHGTDLREVVVHGTTGWQERLAAKPHRKRASTSCGDCGERGHNSRNPRCPARAAR